MGHEQAVLARLKRTRVNVYCVCVFIIVVISEMRTHTIESLHVSKSA